MGNYEQAISDLDDAIRRDPDFALALIGRGRVNFYLGRFAAAAADFEHSLSIDAAQPYEILWLHLARAKTGQDDSEEFHRNVTKIEAGVWPHAVAMLYSGQGTPRQVLSAATVGSANSQHRKSCQASFYLGEYFLMQGRRR
jgi:lipoprotein NlpI